MRCRERFYEAKTWKKSRDNYRKSDKEAFRLCNVRVVTKKRFVYNQDKVCPKESFTIENGRKCDAYLFVI